MANFPSDVVGVVDSNAYTLIDRKPNRGFSIPKRYKNNIFVAQSGHEKRTNFSRRPKRTYALEYSNISGAYKTIIEQFYDARLGEFESFLLDLTYLGLIGSVLVRFDGDLQVTEVITNSTVSSSIYNVQFTLTETYN